MSGDGVSPIDAGHLVAWGMLAAILTVTVYTELRDNRIPNWVTMPGLMVGFLAGYLPGGISLGTSVGGFLIGFGFLFLFYMFGGMGGGDVKLMGAVGALLGYPLILTVLMFTAFIGGAMAILALIWSKDFWRRLAGRFRKTDAEDQAKEPEPVVVPYGIAIVVGSIMTIFLMGR